MSKKSDERDDFRLRPARPQARRNEATAWSKALATVIRYARLSKRGSAAAGAGAAPKGGGAHQQRCAVRVMYTANKVSGQWRAHGRYIARESASGDQRSAGFGPSGDEVPPGETLSRWQNADDPRLWKIIISPEFGDRTDLDRLTRDVMAKMELHLGTKLEWVAVAHFNTEHPHVHIALRGIRDDGSPLDLARDYIRSGIREHAEQACTVQLGYRTSLDAAAAQRRETTAQRPTSLDRIIARSTSTEHPKADAGRFVYQQAARKNGNVPTRLQNLRTMGLAEELGRGTWLVRRDFQTILRSMQQVADRQKILARHGALISDPRLPMQVADLRKLKVLEGRVLLHAEDEQTGRPYMFVEGDAQVHVVYHTPEIATARARGLLRPNCLIRLRRLFENGRPLLEVEDRGTALTPGQQSSKLERSSQAGKSPTAYLGRPYDHEQTPER